MVNVADCRAMETLCLERAKADPQHGSKWLGQAERWRDLARQETAWRFQRKNSQQQMHAGPMAVQPKPVDRDWRQMG
jgi:hypothetical protein